RFHRIAESKPRGIDTETRGRRDADPHHGGRRIDPPLLCMAVDGEKPADAAIRPGGEEHAAMAGARRRFVHGKRGGFHPRHGLTGERQVEMASGETRNEGSGGNGATGKKNEASREHGQASGTICPELARQPSTDGEETPPRAPFPPDSIDLVNKGLTYLVPYMRSPASPRPGTI